jgi:Uncharacterised protein family (UPF0158)
MKVSFDGLETGFLSCSEEIQNWVDRKTGKVIFIASESVVGDIFIEDEDERQATNEILILCGETENDESIEIDENRYVCISPPHSGENFKVMEEFTLKFADEKIQTELLSALQGRKPFRSFKEVLLNYPDEREKWFAFESKKLREFIEEWAEEHQIEIDFEKEK